MHAHARTFEMAESRMQRCRSHLSDAEKDTRRQRDATQEGLLGNKPGKQLRSTAEENTQEQRGTEGGTSERREN